MGSELGKKDVGPETAWQMLVGLSYKAADCNPEPMLFIIDIKHYVPFLSLCREIPLLCVCCGKQWYFTVILCISDLCADSYGISINSV